MNYYTNKSNARRAGISATIRQAKDIYEVKLDKKVVTARANDLFTIEQFEDGFLAVNKADRDEVFTELVDAVLPKPLQGMKADTAIADDKIDEPVIGHFIYCPHCNINLINGARDNAQDLEEALYEKDNKRALAICDSTHEFNCLACGEDFGKEIQLEMPKPKAPAKNPGTGLKIQKDRPEQNGIKRPSEGGKCAAIWEACDALYEVRQIVPMPKDIKALAEENEWNVNNAVIELYQWRKFMGFVGRQK